MNKALIIYSSSTDNTKFTAETIKALLSLKGYGATLSNVPEVGNYIFHENI